MSELEQLKQECEDLRAKLAAAGERERGLRDQLKEAKGFILALEREGSFGVNDGWANDIKRWAVEDIEAALAHPAERTDTERLDHLENEVDREMRDVNPKGYVSLFRRNVPITRESIDADMEVPRG